MTTVVQTSEEDPILAIVRFASELAWADAGPEVAKEQVSRLCEEAEECIVMGRRFDLVLLMLTTADDVIWSKSESPDGALEMAKLISTKITQKPSDKAALRLKILLNLYNLLENRYSRFFVYMSALNLAINGKVTEHVIPLFKKVEGCLKEWKIGISDQRLLFLTISNVLKENKSLAKESFKFLTKYLATCNGEDAHVLAEAKEEAVRTIVEFVKAPEMDLGSTQSGRIPYSLIRDTLQINDDKVEFWVVKAFTAKIMECQMDQMNKVVNVSRSTERVFGEKQWRALRTKLATWRGNIANVITTIQANKIGEDGSQALQG